MKLLYAVPALLLSLSSPSLLAAASQSEESSNGIQYVELTPSFITNYQAHRMGYLKADVTLMVKDQATADAIDRHGPVIRDNLVMLLSRQEEQVLNTSEGKQHLKEEALQEVIAALQAEGEPADVADVLFTSFLVD